MRRTLGRRRAVRPSRPPRRSRATEDPGELRAALVASHERVRAVLDTALDCVVAVDGDGRILEFNPAAERTFGYTADEARGREMAELIVPPALRERHRTGFKRYVDGGAPVLLDRRTEITAMRAGGEEFPVELSITRVALPGPPVFVGYLRDITDRRRAEAELRESRARIVVAADEARRRIERDLHDGIQQQLVALAVTLGRARDGGASELLDAAIEHLFAIVQELRELARGIHPAVLTEDGLEAAVAGLAGRLPIAADLVDVTDERFAAELEATAYFVVAEALTNATRHAHARRAEVRIAKRGQALWVEVRDDGRGGAAPSRGSGLRGLADRVAALGGRFSLDSPPGGGTTLRAELPCAS